MEVILYILLGITIIAITYLFIQVLSGNRKQHHSFQKELKERKVKKKAQEKTREEKAQEKAELKAAMKEQKEKWAKEDAEYEAAVKVRIAELKDEVAESKLKLDALKFAWEESKKYQKEHPTEETTVEADEQAYREYLTVHERLLQKLRIEKDRISLYRKAERWSKRGGRLRRQIFLNRQYYYLITPYTILFIIFTVIPVVMSLALSFTYFNLL